MAVSPRIPPRVTATPEALAVIDRLRTEHGPLVFFQSGSTPMCFGEADMPPSANDVQLGTIGGAPFYVDAEHDERCGRPTLTVDVAAGAAESLSLEGLEGVHFVTRVSCERDPA